MQPSYHYPLVRIVGPLKVRSAKDGKKSGKPSNTHWLQGLVRKYMLYDLSIEIGYVGHFMPETLAHKSTGFLKRAI